MIQRRNRRLWAAPIAVILLVPSLARGQAAAPAPPPDEHATGLPPQVEWKFNFDATWGTFGFANSLFQNPKEGVEENLSDQWFEGSVKPALSAVRKLANSSEIYGKLSATGERTYGSAPDMVGVDISSFGADDLAIGWRSGNASNALGENAFDVMVGRAPFTLGNGMLLWDGAAEGGSRGGYWTNARKAFEMAAIGRFQTGRHKVEGFYLDKDDLPEDDTGTRLWGTNYEFTAGEHSTLGVSYLKFFAHPHTLPERDGLNVFNLRAYLTPIPAMPDLTVDAEYAWERNGEVLSSNAWTLQGEYTLDGAQWKPAFTYRYAFFQGDNADTPRSESFDSLLPGFKDLSSWFQGEIAGEYFVSNSNLISNMARAHLSPFESVGGGMLFYWFNLDRPSSYAPGVTAKDLAFETDAYIDWKINTNFTATFVGAFANPQAAAQQAFGRTKNFAYGMVFLAYSY